MRALIALAVLAAILAAVVFWTSGADRVVLAWAVEGQRAAQTGMAGAIRALRAGDPAAVIPLLSVCFAYGFFHAAGPGHGKMLIGGYGAARAVGPLRLSVVALVSSLAQGATAVLLVAAGVWIVGWSRERMTALAETVLQPAGFVAIAAVGLWLVFRGARSLARRAPAAVTSAGQDHGACGHAHGPAPAEIAGATGWRELAGLVAAVAIRPCTGALFLLVLTAQMGIFLWGVAGTLAMALGTASVTVAVALGAVGARRGLVAGLADGAGQVARVQPAVEIAVGLAVAWIAGGLALASF
jgi:ABC-type nickel/cobalt efflux system permease component RcnA